MRTETDLAKSVVSIAWRKPVEKNLQTPQISETSNTQTQMIEKKTRTSDN